MSGGRRPLRARCLREWLLSTCVFTCSPAERELIFFFFWCRWVKSLVLPICVCGGAGGVGGRGSASGAPVGLCMGTAHPRPHWGPRCCRSSSTAGRQRRGPLPSP